MSIILSNPQANVSFDEACTTIKSYTLPAYIPGPYEAQQKSSKNERLVYIPSLQSICIRKLVEFPDQLELGPVQLTYKPPNSPADPDILHELIPWYNSSISSSDAGFLTHLDPRLWAVLIQLYDGLPAAFRSYTLPLSDVHMPLLQQVPFTSWFSLVTTVQLRGCHEVNDDTIVELRLMHGLSALDVGQTMLSAWGVQRLSKTLGRSALDYSTGRRRLTGLWGLRWLCLRDCKRVKDEVFKGLEAFPLLCVVDLRGTQCSPTAYTSSPFQSNPDPAFFHPTPLQEIFAELSKLTMHDKSRPTLFSHAEPFFLHTTSLNHKPGQRILPATTALEHARPTPASNMFFRETAEDRAWTLQSAQNIADIPQRFSDWPPPIEQLVAAREARRESVAASVLAFYSAFPQGERAAGIEQAQRPQAHRLATSVMSDRTQAKLQRQGQGLMLYRDPPPWLELEKYMHGEDAFPKSAREISVVKRSRTEVDMALMAADDAKRKGNARQVVQAVWGMVGRRAGAATGGECERTKRAVPVSGNPFLRKMEKSAFDDVQMTGEDAGPAEGSVSAARANKSEHKGKNNDMQADASPCEPEVDQKSIFVLPTPTSKPLRPISTLSVPARPPEAIISRSKSLLDRPLVRTTQMKISVFAEEAKTTPKRIMPTSRASFPPRSSGKLQVERSASDMTSVSTRDTHESQDAPVSDASRVVHRKKRKSSGNSSGGFDWKGWSAG